MSRPRAASLPCSVRFQAELLAAPKMTLGPSLAGAGTGPQTVFVGGQVPDFADPHEKTGVGKAQTKCGHTGRYTTPRRCSRSRQGWGAVSVFPRAASNACRCERTAAARSRACCCSYKLIKASKLVMRSESQMGAGNP